MIVKFYMKGGHVVTASGVEKVEMTRDNTTGSYSGYTIKWEEGHSPRLFTLSVPDIIAVHAHDEPNPLSFLHLIGLKK